MQNISNISNIYAAVVAPYGGCPACNGSHGDRILFFNSFTHMIDWIITNFNEYEFLYAKSLSTKYYIHGDTKFYNHNVKEIKIKVYAARFIEYSMYDCEIDSPLITITIEPYKNIYLHDDPVTIDQLSETVANILI